MIIDKYSFGSIVINGEEYNKDVEVRFDLAASEDGVEVLEWWREQGHVFDIPDLERAMNENPSVVVLGNGANGLAEVPERTVQMIEDAGAEPVVDTTDKAVEKFEREVEKAKEKREGKVFGLFHLTC